jgi:hypothetical protein
MTPHRARDSLTAGLAPICSSGTGVIVHLYAGPGAVITVTLIVTVLTCLATVVPYLPELITARSMALIRAAVVAKDISAVEAALINGDSSSQPHSAAPPTEQPSAKPQRRLIRRRRWHDRWREAERDQPRAKDA